MTPKVPFSYHRLWALVLARYDGFRTGLSDASRGPDLDILNHAISAPVDWSCSIRCAGPPTRHSSCWPDSSKVTGLTQYQIERHHHHHRHTHNVDPFDCFSHLLTLIDGDPSSSNVIWSGNTATSLCRTVTIVWSFLLIRRLTPRPEKTVVFVSTLYLVFGLPRTVISVDVITSR